MMPVRLHAFMLSKSPLIDGLFPMMLCGMLSHVSTSVSETIRKPPLAEAQTALGKQKKYDKERFSMAVGIEFFPLQF